MPRRTMSGSMRSAPVLIAIATVTFAVYARVGGHAFVNFDSNVYVYENPIVQRGITLDGIAWAFTTFTAANWHPITWLSIMLDCQLFGSDPGAHHLSSVAYHALNAGLVFVWLRRTTGRCWPATVCAFWFALHPQHVENVAWAAQRKDLVSTTFLLLTCIAYTRYAQHGSRRRMALVATYLALGLMAKPMLVSVPILLLALDVWPLARLTEFGGRRLVVEKLPLFGLAAATGVMTLVAQSSQGAVGDLASFGLGMRLANASVATVGYLLQTIWPAGLCVFHPYPESIPAWKWCGSVAVIMALAYWAWRARRNAPSLAFGATWFLVSILPVIGIVQVGRQAMADRYMYLPHIGLFVGVAFALATRRTQHPRARSWIDVGVTLTTLAWASVTFAQIDSWRDSGSLYRRAIDVTERNAPMTFNLGITAFSSDPERGVELVQQALRWDPDHPLGHYTLGVMLNALGRADEARAAFLEATRRWPRQFDAWANLAANHFAAGDLEAAERAFARALELRPGDRQTRTNLVATRLRLGRFAEILADCEELAAHGDAQDRANLGHCLFGLGRFSEAIPLLESAARDLPDADYLRDLTRQARERAGERAGEPR
ncbi:MAG: tetratricopeptide repeat protein [Planctomycetes bacterium]|nr:tetratricopeptide repeat protein [Planctomycetota bacterium]